MSGMVHHLVRGHASHPRPILVINPNSNPTVTALIRRAAERVLPSDTPACVMSPNGSPHSIETAAHKTEAVPKVLQLVDELGAKNFGAVVMGCFDDLALEELREKLSIPVVGAFESGLISVRSQSKRFGIVTTFEGALKDIRAMMRKHGVTEACSLRAAGMGVAAAAERDGAGEERISDAVEAAIAVDGARAILLGSGGLTGRAPSLQARFGVPIIGAVEAAICIAGALAADEQMASSPSPAIS